MLCGARVCLRAPRRADLELLHGPLREDPDAFMLSDSDPYAPESLEVAQARFDRRLAEEPDGRFAGFTVEAAADLGDTIAAGQVLGDASLWGIDPHTRSAHIGVRLLPQARRQRIGREAAGLLADYAFRIRGLHRLQCDTHADNTPMVRAAERIGFRHEGTLRDAGWRSGRYVDVVVLGLLATEWHEREASG